jgi:hypothetical protein
MIYTCWVDTGPDFGPFEKKQWSSQTAAFAAERHAKYWFKENYDNEDDAAFIVVVSDENGTLSRWDIITQVERTYSVMEIKK